MEKEEIEALINAKLEDHKLEIEIMVNEAIKNIPAGKGMSEAKAAQMISDAINGVVAKVKVTPNPDWNTDKDKPLYGTLDKVKIKSSPGNPYHKDMKGDWIVEGHQANHFIRKGMALPEFELVEKYIQPKQTGKVIGKAGVK